METKPLKKILVFAEHFAPAYKAGGIVRSLENLVKALDRRYEFEVVTSNTNLHRNEKIENVIPNQWTKFTEKCNVIYLSQEKQTFQEIKNIVSTVKPDYVYINGVFSPFFTLLPLFIFKLSLPAKIIIAPRGMLHKGNLRLKWLKKKIFLLGFKLCNLHNNIRWHATDVQEKNDILGIFGDTAEIVLATPLLNRTIPSFRPLSKLSGQLRLATISLIAYKKGHLQLIRTLKALQDKLSVELHIYGPVKDKPAWENCKKEISLLNDNIKVIYHGFIHPEDVEDILREYHFFVLLSHGENFCHAAYESLKVGRPIIISNQTPWRNLAVQKAGWDIDLRDKKVLLDVFKQAHDMDQTSYNNFCNGAQDLAKRFLYASHFEEQYAGLFA